MQQPTLQGRSIVCSYCGGEAAFSNSQRRWYHVDWTKWRPGAPKESREHAFHCEKSNYGLEVMTENEFKIKLIEQKLDGGR